MLPATWPSGDLITTHDMYIAVANHGNILMSKPFDYIPVGLPKTGDAWVAAWIETSLRWAMGLLVLGILTLALVRTWLRRSKLMPPSS